MSTHACRECGDAVASSEPSCLHCGCRAPFQCGVCSKVISSTTLSVARTKKHPHGSYSSEGEPLCHDHWLTRCYQCAGLFRRSEMTRKVVGKHADTNLRHNMKPRIEDVHGSFCPGCAGGTRANSAPGSKSYGWVVLAAMLLSCFVVPWLLLASVHVR